MSLRSNYLATWTVYTAAMLAYGFVPAFATVLVAWYFPIWVVLCLVGLGLAFGFRCPACDLPITRVRFEFNRVVVYGYMFWPPRRCARCDEPLGD